ncbi:hypothetical protein CTEN210_06502 [Chaetoceros tenuissimus]|uniref:Uncharacterized protein n=1 Tax=Chaetoceros tenuissimus TaxID=426638 RepID=A0AAD3H4I0_9STRA|nr:hypothetical protein CTEN210_06502 [Chaetoceros tenuissimus]
MMKTNYAKDEEEIDAFVGKREHLTQIESKKKYFLLGATFIYIFVFAVIMISFIWYGNLHNMMNTTKQQEDFQYPLFNSFNPHQNSWCPYAECNNSPLCKPCNQRFLFILSPGRAGSTSLLTTFNLLPYVRLSGENNDAIFHAYEIMHALDQKQKNFQYDEGNEDGPWMHNAIPKQSLACTSQKIMSTINPPKHEFLTDLSNERELKTHEDDTIIGAKMIRLQSSEWDAQHAVSYFKEHFPCAKFIVNSRDPKAIQSSRIKVGWKQDLPSIKQEYQFLKRFAKLMGDDRAVFLKMEEWSNDVSNLNDVIEWLGYEDCKLSHVQHQNFDGYGKDTSNPLSGECRLRGAS